MAEYDHYTDQNNVIWVITTTGRSMSAAVPDTTDRQYEESLAGEPALITRTMPSADTEAEATERNRAQFSKLRDDIESFAQRHKAAVAEVIHVSAKNPQTASSSSAIAIVIAIALALLARRR